MQDLAALVDRLGCPRLLVVSDLILDRYTRTHILTSLGCERSLTPIQRKE
jgi:hypothetical protein